MATKRKLTPFARFFFIMLFVAPLAYLGASYYNGEDGVQNLKNLLNGDFSFNASKKEKEIIKEVQPTPPPISKVEAANEVAKSIEKPQDETFVNSQIAKLNDELKHKEAQIDTLYLENTRLKEQLKKQELEYKDLKIQLEKIKKALK